MKRHRDELFDGVMRPLAPAPRELLYAVCAFVSASSGREVRLMLEPFPPGTVSGLWIDLGDHEVIAVEQNTLPVHQMVILGHELWHRREAEDRSGGAAQVAARTDYDLAEERRAERFGRLLGAKFRPFLLGTRSSTPPGERDGRIWESLGGR
ncbi:toxin-antitoxin system, toxin component [Streptomyces venezuelae]|uniref:Toxin-antitoxin system, toxin component n=1 Tax=Streptomyces venezuelae TaxID=54571 RepID=A0A5P2CZM5_STRVZ|nr:toxin-antitoxin system, toxin component [Streptomyces venezuelae]QES47417.1 toxin-antitoxin system, toxin component [Streptomyces venezuelae]